MFIRVVEFSTHVGICTQYKDDISHTSFKKVNSFKRDTSIMNTFLDTQTFLNNYICELIILMHRDNVMNSRKLKQHFAYFNN